MDIRILDEGFLVQRAGVDPSTGDAWKPTWISKYDCSEDAVAQWISNQSERKERHRSDILADDTESPWGSVPFQSSSETHSSESRKRPVPDEWTSIRAETQDTGFGLGARTQPPTVTTKRPQYVDMSARRPSYGPLQTGFKSSRSRDAINKRGSDRPTPVLSSMGSVNDPPRPEAPPTEITTEWLLRDFARTAGIAVELRHTFPSNEQSGWCGGDFEGVHGVVLSVLSIRNDTQMSTASVRLRDPHDGIERDYAIPLQYVRPVPPSEAGQNALILLGQFHGQLAKLRHLEDEVSIWLVSAGSCHFELEAEHMVLLHDIDRDL